jgi:hypothetical protein
MNHVVLHDVRAGFFLMVGLAMLAFICAVAALSTVMRPARWADRKPAQFSTVASLVHSFAVSNREIPAPAPTASILKSHLQQPDNSSEIAMDHG